MLILRSLLFYLFLPCWTVVVATIGIPLLLCPHKVRWVSYSWAAVILWALRVICHITYEIRGREHLPSSPCIIAAKHQSAWDTVIFLIEKNKPVFILKRELLFIPFYGQYLPRLGMIAINRAGRSKTLRFLVEKTKERLKRGHSVVIFPEGTRKKIGSPPRYLPGIAALYQDKVLTAPIIPAALNSGLFWPKGSFLKPPGTIILEYLPPVPSGLSSKACMQYLTETIERHTAQLVEEERQKRTK